MKFDWVTFKVSNLEKSLEFYMGLLGLKKASEFGPPEHHIVMLGEMDQPKIELICDNGKIIDNAGTGVSVGLGTENLDSLVDTLKDAGCKVTGPISPAPNIRFFFIPDPDGYVIQLVEQKK